MQVGPCPQMHNLSARDVWLFYYSQWAKQEGSWKRIPVLLSLSLSPPAGLRVAPLFSGDTPWATSPPTHCICTSLILFHWGKCWAELPWHAWGRLAAVGRCRYTPQAQQPCLLSVLALPQAVSFVIFLAKLQKNSVSSASSQSYLHRRILWLKSQEAWYLGLWVWPQVRIHSQRTGNSFKTRY